MMRRDAVTARFLAVTQSVVFVAALLPLGKLIVEAILGDLGANPIEKVTHVTGWWTLTFLLLTLSMTPLRRITGWGVWIRLRRMLGLFAFFYASLHFTTYLVLDQFFDLGSIAKDIVKRPYITVGFSSFILLVPLAVTSTDRMIRRLGGRRWRRLHALVYPIAVGAVLHFSWLVKKDLSRPLTFAALLALLFAIRVIYRWRGANRGNAPAVATRGTFEPR